jgi:hypothetical protein
MPLLSRRYQFERWAKLSLGILVASGFGWGVLGFVDQRIGPDDRWYPLASHTKSVLAGMAICLLIILIFSGEFAAARQRTKLDSETVTNRGPPR